MIRQDSPAPAHLGRPDLHRVPPQGLALGHRAAARRQATGTRASWRLDGFDEDSPERARTHAGVAFGMAWGLADGIAEMLGELAAQLTAAALETHQPHLTLLAALGPARATVTVLVPGAGQIPDPGQISAVTAAADTWGRHHLTTGPCLYAALDTTGGTAP